jgi:hypothetical protein
MARHHAAGRLLLKAVSRGALGAALVMADVGSRDKMRDAGLLTEPSLPRWTFPDHLHPEMIQHYSKKLKPDGMVIVCEKGYTNKMTAGAVVHVIELKYCSDTQPEKQQGRADTQHAELIGLLKTWWSCTVHMHVILLGVGGTIYANLEQTMRMLGVDGHAFERLATDLNMNAIQYIEKAILFRRAQLAAGGWSGKDIDITGYRRKRDNG